MKRWCWGDSLEPILEILNRSGLLFVPSESSYGVAVDPRNPKAVSAVYDLKRRDDGMPLPVIIDSVERLPQLGIDPSIPAVKTLQRLWPAPISAVLPTSMQLAASAGTGTVAVRVPAHSPLRELIRRLEVPLTATSANLSGASPVLEPKELEELFSDSDGLIVDDGRLPGGPPSTVITPRDGGWSLLRVGGVSMSRLKDLLGESVTDGR